MHSAKFITLTNAIDQTPVRLQLTEIVGIITGDLNDFTQHPIYEPISPDAPFGGGISVRRPDPVPPVATTIVYAIGRGWPVTETQGEVLSLMTQAETHAMQQMMKNDALNNVLGNMMDVLKGHLPNNDADHNDGSDN